MPGYREVGLEPPEKGNKSTQHEGRIIYHRDRANLILKKYRVGRAKPDRSDFNFSGKSISGPFVIFLERTKKKKKGKKEGEKRKKKKKKGRGKKRKMKVKKKKKKRKEKKERKI